MMICEIETEAAYPIIAGVIIKAGRHRIDVKGSFPFVTKLENYIFHRQLILRVE
jgi:hypothetical protein